MLIVFVILSWSFFFLFKKKLINLIMLSRYQRAKPVIIDPGLYSLHKSDVFWITEKRSVATAYKLFTGECSEWFLFALLCSMPTTWYYMNLVIFKIDCLLVLLIVVYGLMEETWLFMSVQLLYYVKHASFFIYFLISLFVIDLCIIVINIQLKHVKYQVLI